MKMCIGLDVHLSSCTLAVKNEKGKLTHQMTVETTERDLIAAVKSVPAPRYLCLEEGTMSQWVHDTLYDDVERLYVVVPEKRRGNKTDLQDAIELAEMVRVERFPRLVAKPGGRFKTLRELVRVYDMQIADQVRVKNRIMSIYRQSAIVAKDAYSQKGRAALLDKLSYSKSVAIAAMYEQLDCLMPIVNQSREQMIQELHSHKISRILETCPGLGPIRVAQAIANVHSPHRFTSKKRFLSYCGLGIVVHSSSDFRMQGDQIVRCKTALTRGLNRQCNHRLKHVFKSAAQDMKKQKCPMGDHYRYLMSLGRKESLVKLTIARKIAGTFLAMWKKNERYDPTITTL